MSTIGIVCEYNPFHKGHEYQINEAKRISGADDVVCFMSGSFLQRGVPALMDKYTRTKAALACGVSAVFELPFVYATASARDFATAAVGMMNALGGIDYIAFGAETAELGLLQAVSEIVTDEPPAVSELIRELTASGISYGVARARAVTAYASDNSSCALIPDRLSEVMSAPNNILAIEYLSALIKTGSSIKPLLIPRLYSDYNGTSAESDICSAAAIRQLLEHGHIEDIRRHVPQACYDVISPLHGELFPIFEDDLSAFLSAARLMRGDRPGFVDMDGDLANRLSRLGINQSFTDVASQLGCRNYTRTHINRALLHMITGLTQEFYDSCRRDGFIHYAKLLGLRSDAGSLVRALKKSSSVPVITRASEIRNTSVIGRGMFDYDVKATRIYSSLVYNKFGSDIPDDYRQPVIVL